MFCSFQMVRSTELIPINDDTLSIVQTTSCSPPLVANDGRPVSSSTSSSLSSSSFCPPHNHATIPFKSKREPVNFNETFEATALDFTFSEDDDPLQHQQRTATNFGGHTPPLTHQSPAKQTRTNQIHNDSSRRSSRCSVAVPSSPCKSLTSQPKQFSDKQTSPCHVAALAVATSMSSSFSYSRERNLENEIEQLQETLKDTEERLHGLRLQHDTLSAEHRIARDHQQQYADEKERLQLEVQHLSECANVLRAELKATRDDRTDACEAQKQLQRELDESRAEKRRTHEQSDTDAKTIQDLQRQCKEMERILMRKYPDSVSALIGLFCYFSFPFFHSKFGFVHFLSRLEEYVQWWRIGGDRFVQSPLAGATNCPIGSGCARTRRQGSTDFGQCSDTL